MVNKTETITIPYIAGDGIGEDIWPVAQDVFDKAVAKVYGDEKAIEWLEVQAGENSFQKTGEWLPEETLRLIEKHKVAIKGPLGTPTGGGHRSLNVALRQHFDLYACVRPIKYFTGVPSPMKHPEKVAMTIFRENTEDIYAGIEWEAGEKTTIELIEILQEHFGVTAINDATTTGIGVKPISENGSKRLVREAIRYAITHEKTKFAIIHKGNIQKFTEGSFLKWGLEVAEEMKQEIAQAGLIIEDIIADNFFQQALLNPERFEVVAMTNLNGDYASDALAAQVGGIGISPGANINYDTGHMIFEATHGTAPDIAGKDMANPSSLILSGAMMFDELGWTEVSAVLNDALAATIEAKILTGDFSRFVEDSTRVGTKAFGEALVARFR